MKKRLLLLGTAVLLVLSLSAFMGCSQDDDDGDDSGALVNSVWGGSTPQGGGAGWLTMTFAKDNKVVCAFSYDNTSNDWRYVYSGGSGELSRPDANGKPGGTGWTPGAFTLSDDQKTLTFTSYMGGEREFKRLRSPKGVVEDVLFTLGALPTDLENSVWGGENPMGAWTTFTFQGTATNKVVVSFSQDNSTNNWDYSYTDGDKTGTMASLNAFTINAEETILSITNFFIHGPKDFKRYR
jgi:hypothetical protein